MFRREIRRDERRDVVEVAAVGGVVHETRKAHAEEAEVADLEAQQAAQAQARWRPRAGTGRTRGAAPAAGTPEALTEEQVSELERVAKLKEEGILSDAEFSAEKVKILGL